jgi:hypothetical protein
MFPELSRPELFPQIQRYQTAVLTLLMNPASVNTETLIARVTALPSD